MNVVIFHGWGSTSGDNWFSWLRGELEKSGIQTECPDMPDPHYPTEEGWILSALKCRIEEDTILVGHSLGCLLIMRLLELRKNPIKAAFMVAAFDMNPGIPEISDFFTKPFRYNKIAANANIYILNSDNDPYIPFRVADSLAQKLSARLIAYHNLGHLSAGTGEGRFPELLSMVLDEADKKD
ncbi:MAG: serine hydrolase family protein [Nanoarchaeota archaeon]|nr:serine hydrolase family protein [Nanoarchaeota archaeon]